MYFFRASWLLIVIIFLVFVGFSLSTYTLLFSTTTPDSQKIGNKFTIEVTPGMGAHSIAVVLKQASAINSSIAFRFWVAFYGVSHKLKPGKYEFTIGDSIEKIIYSLVRGKEELVKVTIPEGLTVSTIAQIIEKAGLCTAASFSQVVYSPDLLAKIFYDWGEIKTPEGLVFPETYNFAKGVSPTQIAETMLRMTKEKVDSFSSQIANVGLSPYQACILASIVEREGKLSEEKPLIASVFLNRLRRGIKLESCATVLYALGYHKERILLEDLKIQSPYNTYLHAGLPPTPISNFGEVSLSAVASPAASDFLYFVSNASEGHRFSKTLAEHEKSKRIFFKERAKTVTNNKR